MKFVDVMSPAPTEPLSLTPVAVRDLHFSFDFTLNDKGVTLTLLKEKKLALRGKVIIDIHIHSTIINLISFMQMKGCGQTCWICIPMALQYHSQSRNRERVSMSVARH